MLTTLLINILLVIVCIFIHFAFLGWGARQINNIRLLTHYHLLLHVFSALLAHIIEIMIFGIAYWKLHHYPGFGTLGGDYNGSFFDSVYFSITTYTSVGFGDIEPEGWIRFTAGIEALIGLMMITWTASLLYIVMERQWSDTPKGSNS